MLIQFKEAKVFISSQQSKYLAYSDEARMHREIVQQNYNAA
jgi:hypothetical protein